jgi:hypothetical protein
MAIRICKLTKLIFNKDDFYIFAAFSGEHLTVTYEGDNPPKVLKTVEYQIHGEISNHHKYGKQLKADSYKKVGKIKIHRQPNTFHD